MTNARMRRGAQGVRADLRIEVREGCARKDNLRFGADNILVRMARILLRGRGGRQHLRLCLDVGLVRSARIVLLVLRPLHDLGPGLDVAMLVRSPAVVAPALGCLAMLAILPTEPMKTPFG